MITGTLTILCIAICWYTSGTENIKKNWYAYFMTTLYAINCFTGKL